MIWQNIQLERFVTEIVPYGRSFCRSPDARKVASEWKRDRNSAEEHSYSQALHSVHTVD